MSDGRATVDGMAEAEEEFLRLAMALPPRERWNLGMRLLESLEVKDAGPEQAAAGSAPRPAGVGHGEVSPPGGQS